LRNSKTHETTTGTEYYEIDIFTCSKYGTASVAGLLLNEIMALALDKRRHSSSHSIKHSSYLKTKTKSHSLRSASTTENHRTSIFLPDY
jgi:hypothetical protein